MTLFSGAFSTPRSLYIRMVLMGLECVEQGGCGLPGQATTVQSSHSATRAPPCTLVGGCLLGGTTWGHMELTAVQGRRGSIQRPRIRKLVVTHSSCYGNRILCEYRMKYNII